MSLLWKLSAILVSLTTKLLDLVRFGVNDQTDHIITALSRHQTPVT